MVRQSKSRSEDPSRPDAVDAMLRQWARERPDLDSAGLGIVLRIQILSGIFAGRLKETLAPVGLAPWEFDVLSALRRAGSAGLSPKELCKSAQLTSGAMTHRIDRLEEPGLVRRRPGTTDRRSITVALTPKGRSLINKVMGARMTDACASVEALDRRQREELAGLLRALNPGVHGVLV